MEGKKTLVVIGGGAAGIFCAANAARMDRSLQVIVLEKTGKLLSKVKISGGGRCNTTHACYDIGLMMKKYPRGGQFVRKAFHQFFTTDTISWFASRGVELKAEADGRMFPVTDSSQTIIDCLMKEVNAYGVEIRMHAEVRTIDGLAVVGTVVDTEAGDAGRPGARFQVNLADGRVLEADHLCVACGGYSKPAMFDWIRGLGHTIEDPVPSLFTFNMPGNPITQLMGVSVPEAQVKIVIGGAKLQERAPLLITHWGMSGPVILRLSAWGARELAEQEYTFTAVVNWVPDLTEQGARDRLQQVRFDWAGQKIGSRNPFALPQRLWDYWLAFCGISGEIRWSDLPAREQNKLVSQLCAGEFAVKGKTTFKEEFVTAGGVRLAEVDPATMMSRKTPGLYFSGEILDVDGVTGGFNFQHAWTSGWIAAKHITAAGDAAGGAANDAADA